ncbi:MAG: hypothetical protein HN350_12925 [Phycisphaerales bacterium]|jgi:hypothetical protein|nr:hypothetical protein [Phycisphaerales bacterium]
MSIRSTGILAVAAAYMFSFVSAAVGQEANPTALGKVGEAKLTFETHKKDTTYWTRAWATGGHKFEAKMSLPKLTIGGKPVQMSGVRVKGGSMLGIDRNGDGLVLGAEYLRVDRSGSVTLTAKSGGNDLGIHCTQIEMQYDTAKKAIALMRWKMRGLYSLTGQIDSVNIRIIDDDVNGAYGNNGLDAILIGDAKVAVPLRAYHRIGENFYQLQMSANGEKLKFQQIKFPNIGLVQSPFPTETLMGLVLENGAGAFNLLDCGKDGIPAGTYHLAYGMVGTEKDPLSFFRVKDTVTYTIENNKINLLRIGPPIQLIFSSVFQAVNKTTKAPGHIGIVHPQYAMGSGGEIYGPLSFPNARNEKNRPAIMIVQGSKTLLKTSMPEVKGKVGDYIWRFSPKTNLRGIKVMMAVRSPQLGKLIGVRTIQQIASKIPHAPPGTDTPTVTTTPWDKSDQAAKTPKTPTPVKTAPKPKPPKPPTPTPRPPRPPKPVATDEVRAGRMVKLAQNYIKVGFKAKALESLKATIEKYPNTKAAATAKKLIKSME